MRKTLRLIALILVLSMVLVACGSGGKDTSSDAPVADGGTSAPAEDKPTEEKPAATHKELTIYTALPESEIPYYFNAFEKETGIKINHVRLSAGEILTRMKAESANPNASVMYGGPSDTYIAAAADGLLEPYESPELANAPDEYKDPDNNWSPVYVGALAFACNTDWFEDNGVDYPTTWEDLLKPEFKDQISMAHPSTSGTSYTILSTIYQMMGEDKAWDYLSKLDTNIRQYTKAGAGAPMQAALGEAAIALTFAHDGLKPAAEGYPIKVVFPEDGTGYEIGGIAVIANGPEKEVENAKLFIDWALSKEAQDLYIISASNRLPTNKNADISPGLVPLSDINIIEYDAVWAGENRNDLLEKFAEKIDNAENLME